MFSRCLTSILLFAVFSFNATATEKIDYRLTTLLSGLDVPWGMVLLPKGDVLITERSGKLKLFNPHTQKLSTISGLPNVWTGGQAGLFDVAISPNYAESGWIYFSYAKPLDDEGATALARAKIKADKLLDWQELLVTASRSSKQIHFGGRITFDHKGHVFLSVGERGKRDNAQDLSNEAGKILRLNLDGSIPHDNPFVNTKDAKSTIWSYGHRNPQGLFFNPDSGQLWEAEHGPRGGDEINLIEPGKNYGWPVISYGKEYWAPIAVGEATAKAGMEQPVKYYVPSIATSSLIQYRGTALAELHNALLVGALKSQHLNVVKLDKDGKTALSESRILREVKGRIRNVIETPNGLLVSTDDGRVIAVIAESDPSRRVAQLN